MEEFLKLAINSSGALAVAMIAFHFMNKKDERIERQDERYDRIANEFNKTIQNHLERSNENQKDVAIKFERLTEAMDENAATTRALYKELVRKTKVMREYGIAEVKNERKN